MEALLILEGGGYGGDRWDEIWLEDGLVLELSNFGAVKGAEVLLTITITWLTPPLLIVGTTSSIISPSRRWTCMSAEAAISSPSFFQLSKTIFAVVVVVNVRVFETSKWTWTRGLDTWKFGGVPRDAGRTAATGWAVRHSNPRIAVPAEREFRALRRSVDLYISMSLAFDISSCRAI